MAGNWLNLNGFLDATRAEGPGLRACLWVQGCLRNCPGCCNVDQLPLEPRTVVPASAVCEWLAAAQTAHGIEGVTFLGGEPLLQARGLADVARFARARSLSVMVFTGYDLEDCRRDPLPGVPELLAATDVLVDGAYLRDRPERVRNWVGSTNQRFHYLTSAYDAAIETDPRYRHVVELREEEGRLLLNGCPHVGDGCLRDIRGRSRPAADLPA